MNKYILLLLALFVPSVFAAQSVTLSTKLAGEDLSHSVQVIEQGQFMYETVAASQTDQVCGVTGGVGDYLDTLWIIPATTSPGAVSIKDGAGSAITVFTGGATSVSDLKPFPFVPHISSTSGAWKITTGTNVAAICVGRFAP